MLRSDEFFGHVLQQNCVEAKFYLRTVESGERHS